MKYKSFNSVDSKKKEYSYLTSSLKNFDLNMKNILIKLEDKTIIHKYEVIIILVIFFLKLIGNLLINLNFEGFTSQIASDIIKFFNLTTFVVQSEHLIIITQSIFLVKNIVFILTLIISHLNVDSSNNIVISIMNIMFKLILITFWITISYEIEIAVQVFLFPSSNSNIKVIMLVIGIVNIIISFIMSILYCLYSNKFELNLDEIDYLSRIDTNYEFVLTAIKILFSLNYIITRYLLISNQDKIILIENLSNGLYTILVLVLIFYGYFISYFFMPITNIIFTYFNLCLMMSSLLMFVFINVSFVNKEYMFVIFYIAFYPISYIGWFNYLEKIIGKIPFVEIKDELQIIQYMSHLTFIVCNESISYESSQIQLTGMVKQHEINCIYEKCICKKEKCFLHIPKTKTSFSKSNDSSINNSNKVYQLHLIKSIYEFLMVVTKNQNTNLILMYGYFLLQYIGNYYINIEILLNLKKNKSLTFQQKNSLNKFIQKIYIDVAAENNEKIFFKQEGYRFINFDKMFNFFDNIGFLKENINLALESSISFWSSILNKSEIGIIKENGLNFHNYHKQIESTYEKIFMQYSDHKESNNFYFLYKKYVFGDSFNTEAQSLISMKAIDIIDESLSNEKLYSNKGAIIIASVQNKNKANIENVSDNIYNFLGYKGTECLGQDLKLIMPNFFKARHSKFIIRQYETGRKKILNNEFFTYALHIDGFTVPITIIVKLLPNFSETIQYAAFMNEIIIDNDFIICDNKGKIEMMSKNLSKQLQVNLSLINNVDNYYIHYICKEFLQEIDDINNLDYKIFEDKLKGKKRYKYFLLHFKTDSLIDKIIKDSKRNDIVNSNQSPLIKVTSIKSDILSNYRHEGSLPLYVEKVNYNPCGEENLILLKIYNSLLNDQDINIDEILAVEKHLKLNNIEQNPDMDSEELDDNNVLSQSSESKYTKTNNEEYSHITESEEDSKLYTIRENSRNEKENVNKDKENDNINKGNKIEKMFANLITHPIHDVENNKINLKHKSSKRIGDYIFNEIASKKKKLENNKTINNIKDMNFTENTGSTNSSLSSKAEIDYFKQYLSVKKRFENKKIYQDFEMILIIDMLLLLVIIGIITSNYIFNIKKNTNVYISLNDEFYPMIDSSNYFACILKNTEFVLNSKSNLLNASKFDVINDNFDNFTIYDSTKKSNEIDFILNRYKDINIYNSTYTNSTKEQEYLIDLFSNKYYYTPYEKNSFNNLLYCISNSIDNFKINEKSQFLFSPSLKEIFSQINERTIKGKFFNMSLLTMYNLYNSEISLIDHIENINQSNEIISNIQNNFGIFPISELGKIIFKSLNETEEIISECQKNENIMDLVVIFVIFLISCIIFFSIIIYYKKQYELIALLLGIDEKIINNILENIKFLSNYIKHISFNDKAKSIKLEDEEGLINNENTKKSKVRDLKESKDLGGEEKDNLIENENGKLMKISKKTIQNTMKGSNSVEIKNSISLKIYFNVFIRIFIILILSLITHLLLIFPDNLDKKNIGFINLILNMKTNEHLVITSFMYYSLLIKEKNEGLINTYKVRLNENMERLKLNLFTTKNILYDTIEDLDNESVFENFFSFKFCPSNSTQLNNVESYKYILNSNKYIYECEYENSKIKAEGYSFILGMIYHDLTESITNEKLFNPSKTNDDITNLYESEVYINMNKVFDIFLQYGMNELDFHLKTSTNLFISKFENYFLLLFIFSFISLFFNQVLSIMFVKHIVRIVNYELKNIFSLMPYMVVMSNSKIYEMLRK